MDTGLIIAIVLAAIALVALFLVTRASRERRYESKREEALEMHREAEVKDARAQKRQAEAEIAAATAREQAAAADREREAALQARARAEEIHPDDDPDFGRDDVASRERERSL